MKKPILLLIVLILVVGSFAYGQSPTPSPTPAPTPDRESRALLQGALADFDAKKYDAALEKLVRVEKRQPEDAFVLNLLGSICTKKKDYKTAQQFFERSLAKQPNFFPPKFNIGELLFLERRYAEALAYFEEMQKSDPRNELIQFKVFLCELQMDHLEEAAKKLKKIKYPSDTPAWYYAQAAWEFKNNNNKKAREYLAGAQFIFGPKTGLFNETFEDLGIKPH